MGSVWPGISRCSVGRRPGWALVLLRTPACWAEGLKGRVSDLWSHAASECDLGFLWQLQDRLTLALSPSLCRRLGSLQEKGALVSTWIPRGQIPGLAFWPRRLTLRGAASAPGRLRSPRARGCLLSCGPHSQHVCGGGSSEGEGPCRPIRGWRGFTRPTPHQPLPAPALVTEKTPSKWLAWSWSQLTSALDASPRPAGRRAAH